MSKNEHELFELFFKSITMRMNPPGMDEYTDMRRYWQERFSNAFHGQKESLRNESYAELPIMWLAAWRMQQQEIDTKDKQLIEQGQRFNTQSQQIASLKKQLERVEDSRRDDSLPFTCMVSDVQKVQPNPNKSGVRVITPSGESYVCAWDLASKDGEA